MVRYLGLFWCLTLAILIDLLLSVNTFLVPSIISSLHWSMISLYLFLISVKAYMQTSYFCFLSMCSKKHTVLVIYEYWKCRYKIKLALTLCRFNTIVVSKIRYIKHLFIHELDTLKNIFIRIEPYPLLRNCSLTHI